MKGDSMPTLKQQTAINVEGKTVDVAQWQVWDNDVLIGYLPHDVNSQISVIAILPDGYFSEPVLTDLANQRKAFDGLDSVVNLSPTLEGEQKALHAVLDAIEEESKEDDD
jgi:hypothetical protein